MASGFSFNECCKYIMQMLHEKFSAEADIEIITKLFERNDCWQAIVKVDGLIYQYSRTEHPFPEEAIRELIHRLEAKHGRKHL